MALALTADQLAAFGEVEGTAITAILNYVNNLPRPGVTPGAAVAPYMSFETFPTASDNPYPVPPRLRRTVQERVLDLLDPVNPVQCPLIRTDDSALGQALIRRQGSKGGGQSAQMYELAVLATPLSVCTDLVEALEEHVIPVFQDPTTAPDRESTHKLLSAMLIALTWAKTALHHRHAQLEAFAQLSGDAAHALFTRSFGAYTHFSTPTPHAQQLLLAESNAYIAAAAKRRASELVGRGSRGGRGGRGGRGARGGFTPGRAPVVGVNNPGRAPPRGGGEAPA
jgi:hypothetical protein